MIFPSCKKKKEKKKKGSYGDFQLYPLCSPGVLFFSVAPPSVIELCVLGGGESLYEALSPLSFFFVQNHNMLIYAVM